MSRAVFKLACMVASVLALSYCITIALSLVAAWVHA